MNVKTESNEITSAALRSLGLNTLKRLGWRVSKPPGYGKAQIRQISRGDEVSTIAVRTTRDQWIAFPRDEKDSEWKTLSLVDQVLVVSVDDPDTPRNALVHLIDAKDLMRRFDAEYQARKRAGNKMQLGRGIWLPLYKKKSPENPGGGAGLDYPEIARMPIDSQWNGVGKPIMAGAGTVAGKLSISEAKDRLAKTYGVDPAAIKIIIEA